eukprot:3720069-Rhodomonas_salina.1
MDNDKFQHRRVVLAEAAISLWYCHLVLLLLQWLKSSYRRWKESVGIPSKSIRTRVLQNTKRG